MFALPTSVRVLRQTKREVEGRGGMATKRNNSGGEVVRVGWDATGSGQVVLHAGSVFLPFFFIYFIFVPTGLATPVLSLSFRLARVPTVISIDR